MHDDEFWLEPAECSRSMSVLTRESFMTISVTAYGILRGTIVADACPVGLSLLPLGLYLLYTLLTRNGVGKGAVTHGLPRKKLRPRASETPSLHRGPSPSLQSPHQCSNGDADLVRPAKSGSFDTSRARAEHLPSLPTSRISFSSSPHFSTAEAETSRPVPEEAASTHQDANRGGYL